MPKYGHIADVVLNNIYDHMRLQARLVELKSIGGLVNPSFSYGFMGWTPWLDAAIDTSIYFSPPASVRLGPSFNSQCWQVGIRPPIPTDLINAARLRFRSANVAARGGCTLYYTDGTSTATTFTAAAPDTWQLNSINFVAGKFIERVYLIGPLIFSANVWFDDVTFDMWADRSVACLPGYRLPVTDRAELGYTAKNAFSGEHTLGPGEEHIYLNTGLDVVGCIERLVVWADPPDIVMYMNWNQFFYDIRGLDASFARLHAVGGEDQLMREVLYNAGGECCAVLKAPVKFTTNTYMSLYNPTAANHVVWAACEYYIL